MASDCGSAEVAFIVLAGVPTVVALLLLFVVFPVRDGGKARDAARETYFELASLSRTARWETEGEIRSVHTSLNSDLYSFDSGLWSVGLDLGSLTYDVGVGAGPRVRELEDAVDARRDEFSGLRSSADARFGQLQAGVEERLSELEEAADAALDDHWDESSRRFSRNMWILMVCLWATAAVVVAFGLLGVWGSWRDSRSLSQVGP